MLVVFLHLHPKRPSKSLAGATGSRCTPVQIHLHLLAHLVKLSIHLAHGTGGAAGHTDTVIADRALNTKHEPDLCPECDEASRDTEWNTHKLPNSAGKLAQPTWHAAGGDHGALEVIHAASDGGAPWPHVGLGEGGSHCTAL